MNDDIEAARQAVFKEAGRLGAMRLLASPDYDADATAARARDGQFRKFCAEIDPAGTLTEAARRQKFNAAMNARMAAGRLGKAQKRLLRLKEVRR